MAVDISQMVATNWMSLKKQQEIYETYKNHISEIYDMYWKEIIISIPKVVNGEVINNYKQEIKFVYTVTEILKKFKLGAVKNLSFILQQHPENKKVYCKFCNACFVFKLRTGNNTLCKHTNFCSEESCFVPVSYRHHCDIHWNELKEKSDAIHKQRERERAILIPNDLVSESGYVICLKFNTLDLVKIKLTDIKIFEDHTENTCHFYTRRIEDKYFTWMNSKNLEYFINKYIKTIFNLTYCM